MIIYHGSDVIVEKPEILQSNRLLDFGVGFYTTSNREQATRWAEKVSIRNNTFKQLLSAYIFNLNKTKNELKVIEFTSADEGWLDFIIAHRSGKYTSEKFDIVVGPVADDNVYLAVKLFESGVLNKQETLSRIKVEKLFDQILFHTKESLMLCHFDHFEDVGGIEHGKR